MARVKVDGPRHTVEVEGPDKELVYIVATTKRLYKELDPGPESPKIQAGFSLVTEILQEGAVEAPQIDADEIE